jgi:low temperature requirement protein LtrA
VNADVEHDLSAESSDRSERRPSARRPSLYASSEEGRHATWLELFFDLVFVLAIAELAHYLHGHLTLGGFLGFAFLFLPVWLVWSNISYYADLYDVDGPLYRVTMLAAMLFSIALAVNVHGALDGGSAGFAGAYVALRVLLIGLYAWAWRYVEETRALAAWHIAGFSAGALIWGSSLLVPEPARYWMWGLGLLIEMATPVLAQFLVLEEAPIQRSHVPERFGLFTIVVLGESVLVTGVGVSDTEWAAGSVAVAVLGFAAVGCLWWLYFDHVIDESAVEHAFTHGVRELLVGFSWAYGHLAIYIGLAATAVGIEFAISGAMDPTLEGGARAALCGGVGLYLLAVSVLHPLSPQPFPTMALAARLAVSAFALTLVFAGGALSPLVLMTLLALALVVLTAFEVGWGGRSGEEPRLRLLGRKRKGW